jgi:hypothetical protein
MNINMNININNCFVSNCTIYSSFPVYKIKEIINNSNVIANIDLEFIMEKCKKYEDKYDKMYNYTTYKKGKNFIFSQRNKKKILKLMLNKIEICRCCERDWCIDDPIVLQYIFIIEQKYNKYMCKYQLKQ